MADLRALPSDDYESVEGEVIDSPRHKRQLAKRTNASDRIVPPATRVRREGPFGLVENKSDLARRDRVEKIMHEVQLRDFASQAHDALERRVIDRSVKSMDAIENEIVYPTEEGTLAGELANNVC